jgi:hypothetical protein
MEKVKETEKIQQEEKEQKNVNNDDDVNVLSGDNKVDVEIEPDVKGNSTYIQICSCSLVFNCFTRGNNSKKPI